MPIIIYCVLFNHVDGFQTQLSLLKSSIKFLRELNETKIAGTLFLRLRPATWSKPCHTVTTHHYHFNTSGTVTFCYSLDLLKKKTYNCLYTAYTQMSQKMTASLIHNFCSFWGFRLLIILMQRISKLRWIKILLVIPSVVKTRQCIIHPFQRACIKREADMHFNSQIIHQTKFSTTATQLCSQISSLCTGSGLTLRRSSWRVKAGGKANTQVG